VCQPACEIDVDVSDCAHGCCELILVENGARGWHKMAGFSRCPAFRRAAIHRRLLPAPSCRILGEQDDPWSQFWQSVALGGSLLEGTTVPQLSNLAKLCQPLGSRLAGFGRVFGAWRLARFDGRCQLVSAASPDPHFDGTPTLRRGWPKPARWSELIACCLSVARSSGIKNGHTFWPGLGQKVCPIVSVHCGFLGHP
jgi:hypothetical protein